MPASQNGGASSTNNMNGKMHFDTEDSEYIRDIQRPAVIKEDLNEMERRKRVQQILDSKAFRKELENMITDERQRGNPNAENLHALERLSELLITPRSMTGSYQGGGGMSSSMNGFSGGSTLTSPRMQGGASAQFPPVADLRGTGETSKYSKQERILRTKFASLFRLIHHFQWDQEYAEDRITFRLAPDSHEFLINPDGAKYDEITAGALIKLDSEGNVVDRGQREDGRVSTEDCNAHLAVHRARTDARCVMRMRTAVTVAVSSMECGLVPICQESMIVGPAAMLDEGLATDGDAVAGRLGPENKILLLRNNGFIICGQSIEELFHLAYHLVLACETQIRACRAGIENLCIPSEYARRRTYEVAQGGGGGVNRVTTAGDKEEIKWKVGELEWEAWMRVLDNAGHRTGHIYRQQIFRMRGPAAQSDVEVPPAACAYGTAVDGRNDCELTAQLKPETRAKWLNSPNIYHKVEFEESGTSAPKKLTKWVPDAATDAAHSNPIKILSPHQFTPIGEQSNAKEFKQKQRAMKEGRRAENITAGPQSKILEGVTWEEAAKLQDAEISGTQEMIIIGAASQGIIDPEFRHNAQMYRQLYQPNPFASVTDEEIQNYIHHVERRQGGGGGDITDTSFEITSPEHAGATMEVKEPQQRVTATTEPLPLRMAVSQSVPEVVASINNEASSSARDASESSPQHRTSASAASGKRETTTATSITSKIQPSSMSGWFQRSKSDRFGLKKSMNGGDANQQRYTGGETSRATASDEEMHKDSTHTSPEKKEKKKRFKTPSFLRSKRDKESKKKADR